MEQAQKERPRYISGIDCPDREIFERVWGRVMPEKSAGPIVIDPPTVAGVMAVLPAPSKEGADDALLLEEMLEGMSLQHHKLQAIGKKATGSIARGLNRLADREYRQHRRLTTLYFLMTGRVAMGKTQRSIHRETLPTLLRQEFLQQQQWHRTLLHLAHQWGDSCYYDVFIELSQGTQSQCRGICELLEQMTFGHR